MAVHAASLGVGIWIVIGEPAAYLVLGGFGAERLRAIQHGNVIRLQARCLVDPARASPPLMWEWQTCERFAPDLREYPKTEQAA